MRRIKNVIVIDENKRTQNLFQITIQIFEKNVDMGLGNENSFNKFLLNLQMNKDIYLLALWCTLQKPTLFIKHKPCDIRTNSLNIHVDLCGKQIHMHNTS
jgi:hypothetical protein